MTNNNDLLNGKGCKQDTHSRTRTSIGRCTSVQIDYDVTCLVLNIMVRHNNIENTSLCEVQVC